jgi:hypothetical protein
MGSFARYLLALGTCSIIAGSAGAQLIENFSDGDFTANPAWAGNTADWAVNTDGQLQSNNTVANASFYLSTASTKATVAQWDLWVRLAFNPSSTNLADVYLAASQSNLALTNTAGYFVRLGDTQDEISLYRKDASGATVKLIDGADGTLNTSNNLVRIRVVRNAANQWTLLRDLSGTGNALAAEGTATDATYTTSAFFGVLIRQSTSSFFQRHYFDDIEIKDFVPDVTPPSIVSANATSANVLEVLFSEALNAPSATTAANYTVNNGVGSPATAIQDGTNPLLVRLSFAGNFPSGQTSQLTVNGVRDIAGNTLTNGTANFVYYQPRRYDLVISEIMADPSPQVGLPNANWLEIKNTSNFPINLQGFRLGRGGSLSGLLPSAVLLPDSQLMVTSTSQQATMAAFGRTLSVTSFPTLPISGDLIWLQDAAGAIMHAVSYSPTWYQNDVKAQGGWTLEMIDAKNPCAGATNWRASTDSRGGTPAARNSIAATNADRTPPQVLRAYAPDSVTVMVTYDEPLDSSRASATANYTLSNGIGRPLQAAAQPPLFSSVTLRLGTPLQRGQIYTLTATGITDCSGNTMGSANTARVALSETADSLDVVFNELLFNPPSQGYDYVELYNRSNKTIDLKQLNLASRGSGGTITVIYPLSGENKLLFPGEFAVATEDPDWVSRTYLVKNPAMLQPMSAMPSMPDDKGNLVLLNQLGRMVDNVVYDRKWHFALLDNEEGVSLERIDYSKPTQDKDNWTSAASSAGYGTPTYQNSQYRADLQPQGEITVNPKLFSPDNDGFEDFTLIQFKFPEPGYVANVTIFDAAGRQVRILQRNTTCAASGSFRWDGLDDKLQRVPVGNYVIYTDIFNLKGQRKTFKNSVSVARKF